MADHRPMDAAPASPILRNRASAGFDARINRAIDHVVAHLSEPLRLESVARAAHLSPFHFHRVFRAGTGEALNQFVTRLRLEKALSMLARRPKPAMTDVALACGFGSLSDFSRAFRKRHGCAPGRYDLAAHRARQRDALWSTARAAPRPADADPAAFPVCIREVPAFSVAYIRVVDSYRPDGVPAAIERLRAWAVERGVAGNRWFGYMWDDPMVTALPDCRYDVAVEVPPAMRGGGEVGRHDFPAMRVAEVPVRGGVELELRVLEWLFDTWLPQSGWLPGDQPCFEAWVGAPFAHGFEYFEIDAWLPVVRA